MPYEEMTYTYIYWETRWWCHGVEEVERFDEEEIVMVTTAGVLVVGGNNLHIGKLNLDGGELHVDGTIHTLLYEDNAPSASRGRFPAASVGLLGNCISEQLALFLRSVLLGGVLGLLYDICCGRSAVWAGGSGTAFWIRYTAW